MKRWVRRLQTGLFHLLALAMLAAGYASGCTFTFDSRSEEGEGTTVTARSEPVIVRGGERVHP